MKRDRSGLLLAAAIAAAVAAAAGVTSPYYAGLIAYAAVLGIFAVSVNLVFGYLGYVTFGHAAMFGLGAYTAGIVATKLGWNYWATLPLALLPGAALGALVGFASLRLGGAYFAIASLTVAEILRLVAANWIDLTRGPLGIVVTAPPLPGADWHGIGQQPGYLGVALTCAAAAVFLLYRLLRGPYGRAWLAIRQSLPLAEAIGIPTLRHRVAALTLSGALAALAGYLLVPKIFVLTPDLFAPSYSATGLLAVILGGKGTVLGPILGGTLFAVLPELLRVVDEHRLAVFAVLLLIVVWMLPGGFISLWRRAAPAAAGSAAREPRAPAAIPALTAGAAAASAAPARDDGAPLLEVSGLSKSFRGLQALRDVGFNLWRGEILGLIGPNGAGKTTCLSLLCGARAPDSGTVRFRGAEIGGRAAHTVARAGIARTFQQTTLFGELSARDNVMVATHLLERENVAAAILHTSGFRAREARRRAAADEALATVGLAHRADAAAGALAYGEQRMLAIALALVARPEILLLDEPAAGLNDTEAAQLGVLLGALSAQGVAVLIIDHNLKMIMATCHRVVVLHHGEMLAEATPREIRANPDVIRAYLGGAETGGHDARG